VTPVQLGGATSVRTPTFLGQKEGRRTSTASDERTTAYATGPGLLTSSREPAAASRTHENHRGPRCEELRIQTMGTN
jgi:hypothetical protein